MSEKIFILIGACMILIAVIVIQYLRYRMLRKEKNYAVFHQIKEQTRLARELEQTRIEKETLEKLVIERINPTQLGQGSNLVPSIPTGSTCQDNRREAGTSHQQEVSFPRRRESPAFIRNDKHPNI